MNSRLLDEHVCESKFRKKTKIKKSIRINSELEFQKKKNILEYDCTIALSLHSMLNGMVGYY